MPFPYIGTFMKYGSPAHFACAVILACCLCLPIFPASAEGAEAVEDHTWSRYAKRQQAFEDCVGYTPLPALEPAPVSPKKSSSTPRKKRAATPQKKQTASNTPPSVQKKQDSTPVLVPVMINPICPDNSASSGAQGQAVQTNMTPRVIQGTGTPPQKADITAKQPAATALPEIRQK